MKDVGELVKLDSEESGAQTPQEYLAMLQGQMSGGATPLSAPVKGPVPSSEPPPLWNRPAPYYVNKKEAPAHRLMIEFAAQGYNVKEIAEMTGRTPVCVNNILRQESLQETLVKDIRKVATEDQKVVQVIKDSVVKAVETLASIMDDPNQRASDRIAAADKLLERRYGKANQPMNRGTDVDLNSLPDSELIKMLADN